MIIAASTFFPAEKLERFALAAVHQTEFSLIKLRVSSLHTLHLAVAGNSRMPSAIFLHGGPGSSCRPEHAELFDLNSCHLVLPDQRGCGRSVPHGSLVENTTTELLEDLEAIRSHLAIEKWLLVGGSWGSLLALLYAQKHPERVSGLVLRALFLGTDAELERAFLTLPAVFYPQAHEHFVALVGGGKNQDVLSSYYRLLLSEDPEISRAAAFVWHDYERSLSEVNSEMPDLPADLRPQNAPADRRTPSTPKMEAHYFSRHCFLESHQVLNGMERLRNIPGIIVQSRHDMLCPPENSHRLLKKWPAGKSVMVENAGHSQSDPGVTETMRMAIDKMLTEE